MHYFNNVLGGKIPLSVIESIKGYQHTFRLNQRYPHYQIRETMSSVGNASLDIQGLLDSSYGEYISDSLKLNREGIIKGVNNLLTISANKALNSSRDNLVLIMNFKNKQGPLSEDDIKLIASTGKQLSYDMGVQTLDLIKNLKINNDFKEIFINIVHLTGITNKSKNDIIDIQKQVSHLMELPYGFSTDMYVNLPETLSIQLLPQNVGSCVNKVETGCLFNKKLISNLSDSFVAVLEHVMNNILTSTKYDKTCYFYAISVEVSKALTSASTIETTTEPVKIVENFGAVIGNSTIDSTSKKISELSEIEKKINKNKVIAGMTAMLTKAVTNAASKNQADLVKALAVANRFQMKDAKIGGDLVLTNFTQSVKVDSSMDGNFAQSIANKISNDIGNELKSEIELQSSDKSTEKSNTSVSETDGTTLGGMLDSLAGTVGGAVDSVAGAATDILSASIGNTTRTSTDEETTKTFKDKYELNENFEYKNDNNVSNDLQNLLSSENLAKCAAEIAANNEVDLSGISVEGSVKLDNFKQEAIVNDAMKCVFNQTVLNEISTKIVNSKDDLIKQLIENISDKLTEDKKDQLSGDIYAAGTAASATIAATGTAVSEAAKGAGEGIGTAAKGAGEGISTAAKGVGEGIGSIFSGMMMPMIIMGVLAAAAGGVYYLYQSGYFNKKPKSKDEDEDEE